MSKGQITSNLRSITPPDKKKLYSGFRAGS
jgi:hypothetical protein